MSRGWVVFTRATYRCQGGRHFEDNLVAVSESIWWPFPSQFSGRFRVNLVAISESIGWPFPRCFSVDNMSRNDVLKEEKKTI